MTKSISDKYDPQCLTKALFGWCMWIEANPTPSKQGLRVYGVPQVGTLELGTRRRVSEHHLPIPFVAQREVSTNVCTARCFPLDWCDLPRNHLTCTTFEDVVLIKS